MTKNIEPQKSITDEIFDEFLALLQEHKEFDAETIGKLRQLAQNGDLRKAAQVIKVIKVSPENQA